MNPGREWSNAACCLSGSEFQTPGNPTMHGMLVIAGLLYLWWRAFLVADARSLTARLNMFREAIQVCHYKRFPQHGPSQGWEIVIQTARP